MRRFQNLSQPIPLDIDALCFSQQKNFLNDGSAFADAVNSRRSGKTTGCAIKLIKTCLARPGTTNFYITYARTDAKGIIWPVLHALNRKHRLGGVPNESDLTWRYPNDSWIRLGGAATRAEIERFRGYPVGIAFVDESQRFGSYLRDLVDDVLMPACIDYGGAVRLMGTPGKVPVGYFFEVTKNSEWSHHHWTLFDNPWIERKSGKTARQILDAELKRRGVTEDDPTIQREFFGRWVTDKAKLVIAYDPYVNHFETLPDNTFTNTIMGVDLGTDDADALCVLAYSHSSSSTYLVDEFVKSKQSVSELIAQVEILRAKWKPCKIIVDTGGLGKKIAEEMRRRFSVPVQAADKVRKFENIELLNDALKAKNFFAKKDSRFAQDGVLLEWDEEKTTPDKKVISDRFHSDIVDATLYAFKESPAFSFRPEAPKPVKGSADWAKAEQERLEEEAVEYFKRQESKEPWEVY